MVAAVKDRQQHRWIAGISQCLIEIHHNIRFAVVAYPLVHIVTFAIFGRGIECPQRQAFQHKTIMAG